MFTKFKKNTSSIFSSLLIYWQRSSCLKLNTVYCTVPSSLPAPSKITGYQSEFSAFCPSPFFCLFLDHFAAASLNAAHFKIQCNLNFGGRIGEFQISNNWIIYWRSKVAFCPLTCRSLWSNFFSQFPATSTLHFNWIMQFIIHTLTPAHTQTNFNRTWSSIKLDFPLFSGNFCVQLTFSSNIYVSLDATPEILCQFQLE